VVENCVLRKILWPEGGGEVAGYCWKLHNEELLGFCFLLNVTLGDTNAIE